jgi:hypothetical protein
MGTPNTPDVRQILLGDQKIELSLNQQVALLDARRDFLRPYLDYMPWDTLVRGVNFHHLYTYSGSWTLGSQDLTGVEVLVTDGLSLDLRGIFTEALFSDEEGDPRYTQFVVGFTRQNQWVFCKVCCETAGAQWVKPNKVVLKQLETKELCEMMKSPTSDWWFRQLWDLLTKLVGKWVRDRSRRYNQANLVAEKIDAENWLLGDSRQVHNLGLMELSSGIQEQRLVARSR